jgi:hypothetical protein
MLISNQYILNLGRLILKNHPRTRAKLLGMARLASPYIPKYNNGLDSITEPARCTYFQIKEMYKWQQQNNRR